ncbi:hypothetical protein L9F63_020796, partial [Diploptera punctata]
IIVVITISKHLANFIEFRTKIYKLPQLKGHMVFGNMLCTLVPPNPCSLQVVLAVFVSMLRDQTTFNAELLESVGRPVTEGPPMSVWWLASFPIIQIHHPEHLEVILGNVKYIEKSWFYTFLQPWLGTGLITSEGSKWRPHRKMLTPTFHFKILENFIEVFTRNSETLVKNLKSNIGAENVDIFPYISSCALDIICESSMGVKINAQDQENKSDYVEAESNVDAFVFSRMMSPWLFPDFLYNLSPAGKRFKKHVNTIQTVTDNVIRDRRRLFNEKNDLVQQRRPTPDLSDLANIYIQGNDNCKRNLSRGLISPVDK